MRAAAFLTSGLRQDHPEEVNCFSEAPWSFPGALPCHQVKRLGGTDSMQERQEQEDLPAQLTLGSVFLLDTLPQAHSLLSAMSDLRSLKLSKFSISKKCLYYHGAGGSRFFLDSLNPRDCSGNLSLSSFL